MFAVRSAQIFDECSRRSLAESLPFPEVLRRCADAGIDRYVADLVSGRKVAYDRAQGWHVSAEVLPSLSVAEMFSESAVRRALEQIQQRQVTYRAFLEALAAAGTVGYGVFITGRRAIYWGRHGQEHIEHFPARA